MQVWSESSGAPDAAARKTGGWRRTLGRAFLLLAIGALCLAAAAAIGILIFGGFGTTAARILVTVVGFAGYSLLALAATTALGRKPVWLGPVGIAAAAAGFFLFVAVIWFTPNGSLLGRLTGSSLTCAVSLAHAALLLLLTRRVSTGPISYVRRATFGANVVLTAMILIPLLSAWDPPATYFRILSAVAVLAVLGTLVTPIVQKLAAGPALKPVETMKHPSSIDPLQLRYRGRTFVVEWGELAQPEHRLTIAAWEVKEGDWTAIPAITGRQMEEQDPHAALASAVRRITQAVDDEAAVA